MEWDEVVEHLRARYRVGQVTGSWIELWRSFREGTSAIRQQQIVRSAELHGELYYVIEAEIAAPAHARAVLCASYQLAIGTLVDRGDALVAHAPLPASAVTPETLERVLRAIGHEAMRLSMLVWQGQRDAAAEEPSAA